MEDRDPGACHVSCFICDEGINGNGISLLTSSIPYSTLIMKIEQLLGDNVMIIVSKDDQLCTGCYGLLNHVERLESDLNSVRLSLKGYLNVKYHLEESDNPDIVAKESATLDNSFMDINTTNFAPNPDSDDTSNLQQYESRLVQYTCNYCSYKTHDQAASMNHAKSHTKRVIYKCSKCDKKFASRTGIENHILNVHRLHSASSGAVETDASVPPVPLYRTFKCGLCSVTYPTKGELIEHFEVHRNHGEMNQHQSNVISDTEKNSNDDTFMQDLVENADDEYNAVELMLKKLHGLSNEERSLAECSQSAEIHIQITGNELSTSGLLEQFKGEPHYDNSMESEQDVSINETESLQPSENNETDVKVRQIYPKLTDKPELNGKMFVCSMCGLRTPVAAQMKRHIKGHIAMKKKLYTCPVCAKVLTTLSNLKRHVKNHDSEPVNCSVCEKTLSDRLHLKQHMLEQHPQVYDCTICGDTFPTPLLRKNHELTHQDLPHYKCPEEKCQHIFLSETSLKNHQAAKHNNDLKSDITCNICHKSMTTLYNLRRHMLSHDKFSGSVNCNLCDAQLADRIRLRQHMEEYHPEAHKCGFCPKLFNNKKDCKLHELTHPERLFHKCGICDKEFASVNRLTKHTQLVHREAKCSYCNKQITNMTKLMEHEKRHEKFSKNYPCSVCEKTFRTPTGLKYHMSVHSGDYPLRCNVCNRGFHSNNVLYDHMATHTKEIRYTCEKCGRNFSSNSTYRTHRLWHDNPYPYSCKICHRKFKHTSVLAVHKRRAHTFARPYVCPYCKFAFSVSSSLNKHIMLHTREFQHRCTHCEKGYTTRTKLAQHLAKAHDDDTMINEKPKPCEYKMVLRPEELADVFDRTNEEVEEEEVIGEQTNESSVQDQQILNFVTLETVAMPDHSIYAIFETET